MALWCVAAGVWFLAGAALGLSVHQPDREQADLDRGVALLFGVVAVALLWLAARG